MGNTAHKQRQNPMPYYPFHLSQINGWHFERDNNEIVTLEGGTDQSYFPTKREALSYAKSLGWGFNRKTSKIRLKPITDSSGITWVQFDPSMMAE
jgi:hypothetical protein